MRRHGAAAPFAGGMPVDVVGAVGPYPGFASQRNRNRRSRVMLLGRAPSACFEEHDARAWCKRSSGDGRAPDNRGENGSPARPATERGGWVQVKLQLSRIALGSAVALSLVGGGLLTASDAMAQCGGTTVDKKGEPVAAPAAVMITGGTITNQTVIDISANAGTSISDASGGNNNLALTGGGNDGGDGGVDTAASGNGGVATSAANGGAVSIQDINSGGNAGNAIAVGDATCAPFTAPEKPGKEVPAKGPEAAPGKVVVALPDTGVGIGDPSALFML